MMPSWTQCLQAIVLLAIGGFALVILSGFWHVAALLAVAVGIVWLFWTNRARPK